ncbi:AbiTii domain-containing protein [Streptomyces nodosus]|uniref:AbiTii domain-containing protein n=1 Tax=Streptomyces nodosus TaxID=40318 RepID=UPI003817C3D2
MSKQPPLDKFEQDVLDESVPIQQLLRLVIVLGGRAFSEPLRSWARNELQGYLSPDAPLPTYRTIIAPLQADSHSRFWQGRNETISVLDLPEIAHDLISEQLPVTFSVGKIQNLIAGQDSHTPLKLGLPGSAELARLMTSERSGHGVVVERIYWSVHVSALHDILEQVRNRLLEFVAELRATMEPGEQEPTVGQVHQAVQTINITVGDYSPVHVTAPHRHSATVSFPTRPRHRWWPQR